MSRRKFPEAFLVQNPPGSGKTRAVWKHLLAGCLRGSKRTQRSWNARIEKTLIWVPNERVKRVWLRELGILAKKARLIDAAEDEIRGASCKKLLTLFGTKLKAPEFITYGQACKSKRQKENAYWILDEWHRLPNAITRACLVYCEEKKETPWFIGGKKVKKAIYFVSATPVNPVLEQETDLDESPLGDEAVQQKITEGVGKALSVIAALSGKSRPDDKVHFKKALRCMQVRQLKRHKWVYPHPIRFRPQSNAPEFGDDGWLARILAGDPTPRWTEEYAAVTGLVRTDKKFKLVNNKLGKSQSCFWHHYKHLHIAKEEEKGCAVDWIKGHPRFDYLQRLLVARGVLTKGNGTFGLGKNKVLIFCVHQGVARGLVEVLRSLLPEADQEKVYSNVLHSRSNMETEFNDPEGEVHILVATDALSESIDLHGACTQLIHYELPWSPLRLLQRIGRLTRLKADGSPNNDAVRIAHVIYPGSVEEERVNRLVRRIHLLNEHELWPDGAKDEKTIINALIGSGPSALLPALRTPKPG